MLDVLILIFTNIILIITLTLVIIALILIIITLTLVIITLILIIMMSGENELSSGGRLSVFPNGSLVSDDFKTNQSHNTVQTLFIGLKSDYCLAL